MLHESTSISDHIKSVSYTHLLTSSGTLIPFSLKALITPIAISSDEHTTPSNFLPLSKNFSTALYPLLTFKSLKNSKSSSDFNPFSCNAFSYPKCLSDVYKRQKLDFERLVEIKEKVDIPLVLHGASDVPDDLVKKAISLGICKVNVATDLKIPFAKAVKEYLDEHNGESDPRKYMTPGKLAMKEIVKNKSEVCGSMNRY